jgi:hypothetical protein
MAQQEVQIVVRVKDQFSQALGKAGGNVQQFAEKAKGAAARVKGAFSGIGKTIGDNKLAFAALGAAAVAAAKQLAGFFLSAVSAADRTAKLSQQLGISTEELSALNYQAQLAGMSTEDLAGSLKIFSRNMTDAANGTGGAVQAFKALGLETKNTDGTLKSQTQLMGEISDKFAETADGAGKTALAMDIFGRSGASMIPLLNQGSAALAEQTEEAKRLGIVLDSDTGKKAEAFNDAMFRMKQSAQGAMMGIVGELAPAVTGAFDHIREAVAEATNSDAFKAWASGFGKAVNFIVGAVRIVWNVFQLTGQNVGIAIGTMAALVINSFETIIKATMAVGRAVNGVFTLSFSEIKAGFSDFGSVVKNGVKQVPAIAGVAFAEMKENFKTQGDDIVSAAKFMFGSQEDGQKKLTEATKQESKKRLDYQVIDTEAAAKAAKDAEGARLKALEEAAKLAEEKRKQIIEAQKMLSDARIAGLQQELAAEGVAFEQQRALRATQGALELEALRAEREQKLLDLQGNEEAQLLIKEGYLLKERQLKEDALRADEAITAARMKLATDETKNALGNLARATEGSKKFFALNKAFSMAQAGISGAEAAVHSFSAGAKIGGPPLGFAFAAASVAATAKMVSDIASQKFARGGFPRGRDALATLNDDPRGGQEAVLNAGAVRTLGFGGINALNAGRGLQGGGQRLSVNLGGVVVNGGDPAQVQAAIESGIDRAAQRLQRMLRYNRENNVPESVFA